MVSLLSGWSQVPSRKPYHTSLDLIGQIAVLWVKKLSHSQLDAPRLSRIP
jgi:hypothetical protein